MLRTDGAVFYKLQIVKATGNDARGGVDLRYFNDTAVAELNISVRMEAMSNSNFTRQIVEVKAGMYLVYFSGIFLEV